MRCFSRIIDKKPTSVILGKRHTGWRFLMTFNIHHNYLIVKPKIHIITVILSFLIDSLEIL